jgi:hypothetical protein
MADNVLIHAPALIAGHAAGHYQLPEAITTAHTARERVAAALADLRTRQGHVALGTMVDRLADTFVAAAGRNGALTTTPGAALVTAEAEDHELAASIRVADAALTLASTAFARTIVTNLDAIIAALDAAVAETLTAVRAVAPRFTTSIPGPESVPHLPPDVARDRAILAASTDRYQAIRDIQRRCDRLAGGTDAGGLFAEFPDPSAVWQGREGGIRLSTWRPWPEQPMERLLWLAALPVGAVRVLPVAEQNRLAIERQKRSTLRRPGDVLGATLGV